MLHSMTSGMKWVGNGAVSQISALGEMVGIHHDLP
jgi:hypothetical protein